MSNATRKPARKSTPLPAVKGAVKVLRPVGTVGPAENRVGEIEVNGKAYFVRVQSGGYQLVGWDDRREEFTDYHLPADLSSCECLDYLSRGHRREDGCCKHMKTCRALINAVKLPALTPVCEPIADHYGDAEADALAERWGGIEVEAA
jgi:hypothetical protein